MNLNFDKGNGLIPAIIQDAITSEVLMLGYMNQEAYNLTLSEKRVCFYSRSKQRLWTKGETSGNYLNLVDIKSDCDNDTLLIRVNPEGPVCHKGTDTCFGNSSSKGFMYQLEDIIAQRIDANNKNSYTNKLYKKGINKVAQKVGEEAVETVIEAIDKNRERLIYETADLLYHLLILLKASGLKLSDIETELKGRH